MLIKQIRTKELNAGKDMFGEKGPIRVESLLQLNREEKSGFLKMIQ